MRSAFLRRRKTEGAASTAKLHVSVVQRAARHVGVCVHLEDCLPDRLSAPLLLKKERVRQARTCMQMMHVSQSSFDSAPSELSLRSPATRLSLSPRRRFFW